MNSPKDKLEEKIKEIIYEVGYMDRDYRKSLKKATKQILTLLTSEVEKYYIQGYMDSFEPDNGEMPDGSLSTRQINILTKQAKEKLEQRKALSDIGGNKI